MGTFDKSRFSGIFIFAAVSAGGVTGTADRSRESGRLKVGVEWVSTDNDSRGAVKVGVECVNTASDSIGAVSFGVEWVNTANDSRGAVSVGIDAR